MWFCLGGLSSWGDSFSDVGVLGSLDSKGSNIYSRPEPIGSPLPVRSLIDFRGGSPPVVRYAGVEVADLLGRCPLDSASVGINEILNLLIGKVRSSISRMEQHGGAHCEALEKRLNASSSKVASTLTDQFVTGVSESQAAINRETQKASATNELVLTLSDLFQSQCINSVDDRIVVQKLFAQLLTLGGVFTGGWQGTLAATSGQFIGTLPIFPSEGDRAMRILGRYEEKSQRASFLCNYRQMQKMNCLLFAGPQETIVGGIDLTGETGPYFTTKASLAKIKSEAPGALADVMILSEVSHSTEAFMSAMEKEDAFKQNRVEGFLVLRDWCFEHKLNDFEVPSNFSKVLQFDLQNIRSTCSELNQFQWSELRLTDGSEKLLFNAYWQLARLKFFYDSTYLSKEISQEISKDINDLNLGYIVKTWESLKYFEDLVKSLDKARSTSSGNQFRMNYNDLVSGLGSTLAKRSLRSLMNENYKTIKNSAEARSRALIAELDLCQTLDPTLACLYVDRPFESKLQIEWAKWCVGPKSPVCSGVNGVEDKNKLLSDPSNRAYFDSLCGQ